MTTASATRNTTPPPPRAEPRRLAAAALAALLLVAAAPEDPVVAQSGTDSLTFSQAQRMIAASDPATQQKLRSDPAALSDFIRNALLVRAVAAEAFAEKWDTRPEIAPLIAQARAQVVTQSFIAAHAQVPAGYPSDTDIQAAYDANKNRLLVPRQYHVAQIFAPLPAGAKPDAIAAAKHQLAQLGVQIAHGRLSFEAAQKSGAAAAQGQNGDLGWLPEDKLIEPVKSALAAQPSGSVGDPVCTVTGCHLFKLIETRPAGPAPLAAVRDQLVRALRQQKQAEAERAYANTLLAKQPVRVNEIQLARLAQ